MNPHRGAVALALSLLAPAAGAHPLGPWSIDRSATLEIRREGIAVRYAADLAAQPAESALADWQRDPKGWAKSRAAELAEGLALTVDGKPLPLTVRAADAAPTRDETGAPGLRLEVELAATASFGNAPRTVRFIDGNWPIHPGVKRAQATAGPGLTLPDAPKAPVERLTVTVVAAEAQRRTDGGAIAGTVLATAALGIVRRRR